MKKNVIFSGVVGVVLLFGAGICQAEKWDKNNFEDAKVEVGYYKVDSIKVKGKVVSWTEKYILTKVGAAEVKNELSMHQKCKQNIEKMGDATQYQLDYQIRSGKFRGVTKRYYNKNSELICTSKDMGKEFVSNWSDILRGSPMQQAKYDLLTKYKVKFE